MHHTLPLTPSAIHGVFSAALPPALTLDSGDTLSLSTLDAWWGNEPFQSEYAPRTLFAGATPTRGHALTGPIAVRNLAPGDALQIDLLSLTPGPYGFTECGGSPWPHYRRLGADQGPPRMLLWEIDAARNVARTTNLPRNLDLTTHPFLGVIGLCPAGPGEHSTTPPRPCGGNLDCNLLTAGSTLFLPAQVPGGLLSLGDGHAAQGDGELSNNGIECPMADVRLRLTARPDLRLTTPLIRTPTAWATLGLAPTLDEAAYHASNAMLDLLCLHLNLSRPEALGLASVAIDLHITQLVNGTKGVHAVWHDSALRAPTPP